MGKKEKQMPEKCAVKLTELKSQYKDVYVVEVHTNNDDEYNIFGFFRKPTFQEFRIIYSYMSKGDDLIADRKLIETCFIGGNPLILDIDNNIDIFLSVKSSLGGLIEIMASTLKKK